MQKDILEKDTMVDAKIWMKKNSKIYYKSNCFFFMNNYDILKKNKRSK